MLISEAKKGIKCFVQGYGEKPDRFYIETFGVIAETPSPIKYIVFDIYDGFDKENHIVTLYTSSFTETDFEEFYGLEETECKKATK